MGVLSAVASPLPCCCCYAPAPPCPSLHATPLHIRIHLNELAPPLAPPSCTQMVVHTKLLAELIELSSTTGQVAFTNWFFWLELVLVLVFGIYWLFRFTQCLGMFDPLLIIPLMQTAFIIFGAIAGGIFFKARDPRAHPLRCALRSRLPDALPLPPPSPSLCTHAHGSLHPRAPAPAPAPKHGSLHPRTSHPDSRVAPSPRPRWTRRVRRSSTTSDSIGRGPAWRGRCTSLGSACPWAACT